MVNHPKVSSAMKIVFLAAPGIYTPVVASKPVINDTASLYASEEPAGAIYFVYARALMPYVSKSITI